MILNSATAGHPVIIETDRLILKAVTPSLIHELISTLDEAEFLSRLGLANEEYIHYMNMHIKGMETHRISVYYFILVDKATMKIIGDCGFHTWNATHARAELFYNMKNEEFRQKGLMKEALNKVIEFGFTTLNLNRIEGLVAPWNEASTRLIKGMGFTFEGTMRQDYIVDGKYTDSNCYSLLKEEWLANQQLR